MTDRTHTTDLTLTDIIDQLAHPFDISDIQVKPGAVSSEGNSALALAYADWRTYADRLDDVVGTANWSIQLVPWGDLRVIARLSILGITKDATGEGDMGDPNAGTIAEAQAKKRACAEFGLGRYLYSLPRIWGRGTGDRRSFRFADREIERCVYEMYRALELPTTATSTQPTPPASRVAPAAPAAPLHTAAQIAPARKALADAKAASDTPKPALVTDKQLALIISLVIDIREADLNTWPAIDDLGDHAGVAHLANLNRRDSHRARTMTLRAASTLIGELQKLKQDASTADIAQTA